MSCNKETERAIRLRENKRRNRAREKEYTADLERRLRQFEQDGVRATIEVQSAARQVAEENIYLRELLLVLGIDGSAVKDWIARRKSSSSTDAKGGGRSGCLKTGSCSKGKEREAPSMSSSRPRCSQPHHTGCQKQNPPPLGGSISDSESVKQTSSTIEEITVPDLTSPSEENNPSMDNQGTTHPHKDQPSMDQSPSCSKSTQASSSELAPCQLRTRLTTNPTSDISTILAAAPELDPSATNTSSEGLPCESAYKLVMRYATSDEKLDALARKLEEGCVPDSCGGGCKVRNETVSQALLDICL